MNHSFPNPIAPRWLIGGNAQTLYAKALQKSAPNYRRELVRDSFGEDYIAYDFVDASDKNAPCLVLFHGLEGSSKSHYAVELMLAVQAADWHGVVVHSRSCGGVPSKRLYHSGDTREAAHTFQLLAQRYTKIFAVGVSMGGNVLAKYLGETRNAAIATAAATVSTPFDLKASERALEKGVARQLYTPYFMHTLLQKVPPTNQKFRHLGEFDDAFTAPMHGFANKDEYYEKASSKPYLREIAIPTLLINAKNDPFVPAHSLPTVADVSDSVFLLQPENGGHVGFVTGEGKGNLDWLPQTLLAWFENFK